MRISNEEKTEDPCADWDRDILGCVLGVNKVMLVDSRQLDTWKIN